MELTAIEEKRLQRKFDRYLQSNVLLPADLPLLCLLAVNLPGMKLRSRIPSIPVSVVVISPSRLHS
jgi:hypothetical protein